MPPELDVLFGPDNEERTTAMDLVESGEIQVAAIHDVDSAWLGNDCIEDLDIVDFARGNPHNGRNAAMKVEQGMQFDRPFGLAEQRPGEKGETQIDGGGIERVGRLLEFQRKIVASIEYLRGGNQLAGKIHVNPPIAPLVGVGQVAAGDVSLDPHVVQLVFPGLEAGFDVPQTFPVGELSKSQAQELIPAGRRPHSVVGVVSLHTAVKGHIGQMIDQLGKVRS